jgi:hypothetical protein
MILPQLIQIYTSENAMEMDSLETLVIHERILLLPITNRNKSKFLNMLGDIYRMHYKASNQINDLHQAICFYDDAI